MAERTNSRFDIGFPIIDSHIHLYAESHIPTLSWAPSLPDGHVLKGQRSLNEYVAVTKLATATAGVRNLVGFVFVETDRKSSLTPDNDGWKHPFEEIKFLRRIRAGTHIQHDDEGFDSRDAGLLLGAVPWAPVAADPETLQKYLDVANTSADLQSKSGLVRGFRYLLQDKPRSHCLETPFFESLLQLERAGARTFDLGVDFRQSGPHQLTEAILMLQKFYAQSTGEMKIVINHLCKPNLRYDICTPDQTAADRKLWEHSIKALADLPTTHMKLSGLFSELPPQGSGKKIPVNELFERTRFEIDVIFDNFGAENIMFGSDWPVCNVGGSSPDSAWLEWVLFVHAAMQEKGLSNREKARVWAGTAREVYDLDIDLDGWKPS